MSRNVIIIDPSLRDNKSHHHVINSNLSRRVVEFDGNIQVFAHKSAVPDCFDYSVKSHFSRSIYSDIPDLSDRSYDNLVSSFQTEVRAILDAAAPPFYLIVHSTTAALLQGVANAISAHPRKFTFLVAQLMFASKSLAQADSSRENLRSLNPIAKIYQFSLRLRRWQSQHKSLQRYSRAMHALDKLQEAGNLRLSLSTSCDEFSKFYSGILHKPIPVHPCALHTRDDLKVDNLRLEPTSNRPRILLLMGDPKIDKGTRWIADALPTILAACPELDFWAHLGANRFRNADIEAQLNAIRSVANSNPNLHLAEGYLDPDSWNTVLGSLNGILLSYDPKVYFNKTSGVFWEVISKAQPTTKMIITRGTWMEREASAWNIGVSTCEYESTTQLSALLSSWSSLPCIGDVLENNPVRWNIYFGQGNDDYLLSQLFGSS